MIMIETVRENENSIKIDTEDEIMNVISSELMQVKSERKMKLKSISTKINQSVPETGRILQENKQIKEKNKSIYKPTSTRVTYDCTRCPIFQPSN
jgi:hypothetical protein